MSTQAGELGPASASSQLAHAGRSSFSAAALSACSASVRARRCGFFVQPMSHEFAWGRDVFGLAIAVQNLLWGLGQPFAGAIADRFGLFRVMCVGALLYAGGLLLMRYSVDAAVARTSAPACMVGFGLAGCSFNLVLSAFAKLLPAEKRGLALGAGTAAGSFGQFLFAPIGVALIDNFGWQQALTVFGFLMLLIVPLSFALSTPPVAGAANAAPASSRPFTRALAEAFGHRSYVLLVLGFFTCGFQLAFITVHLPAFLVDRGISTQIGGWVIAAIGLFNIMGSLSVGYLQNSLPKRYILSAIYFTRALATSPSSRSRSRRLGDRVRRRHRPDLAVDGAADLGAGGADVRHALARDAVRLRFLQPSGRRLPRRLSRRHRVREVRFLHADLVALGPVRRALRADQSSDRGETGPAGGCAACLIG